MAMSDVYRVDAYVDKKKIAIPEFFSREIYAVTFAFERAVAHADGDVSEVREVYAPSGGGLPFLFYAQKWVEPLVGEGPVKSDLLEMVVTRVRVHDDMVDLPA